MVELLDSTLREGEQTPGVYFPSHVKLDIAEQLDKLGISYIEAGHPIVSENIRQSIDMIADKGLNATIGAHSRSLEKDIDLALDCGVKFLGIFYCVSNDRLNNIFYKNLDEAVHQITSAISYAKKRCPEIIIRYTPEDTVRSNFDNVLTASIEAVKAGADIISVADTTGYMVPGLAGRSMYDFIIKLKTDFAKQGITPKLAVHCHNDRGLALANALDAYHAGVDIIDATVLGLGERTGIVDLASLMYTLKADFDVENKWDLKILPQLYELVSKYSKVKIPTNLPLVGRHAFTHCAGVHTQAASKDAIHYQSVDPNVVGRVMRVSLDHMSGFSSVKYSLEKIGLSEVSQEFISQVLNEVKRVGESGRSVDVEELWKIVNLLNHLNENGGLN